MTFLYRSALWESAGEMPSMVEVPKFTFCGGAQLMVRVKSLLSVIIDYTKKADDARHAFRIHMPDEKELNWLKSTTQQYFNSDNIYCSAWIRAWSETKQRDATPQLQAKLAISITMIAVLRRTASMDEPCILAQQTTRQYRAPSAEL